MDNKIKQRRRELGLTQAELSRASTIPRSTIAEVEAGDRMPSVLIALLLARALRTTVEDLFPLSDI